LIIVGLPTNDFGGQEPLDNASIGAFCARNYGVDFLMLQKCSTRNPNQHPVFAWLTRQNLNGTSSSRVWWNFQKYLVDENGQLIDYFFPFTKPDSRRITRHLEP
jgi:glutathione peroxidase